MENLVIGVDDGPELVSGVSLRVGRGRVLGLVGESGCGKSVTSYAMLGLLAPGTVGAVGPHPAGTAPTSRTRRREDPAAGPWARDRVHLAGADAARSTRCSPSAGSSSASVKRLRGVGGREAKRIALRAARPMSASSTPRACSRATRTRSRAAWPSASRSPSPFPAGRSCSSPTSPRPRWTSPSRPRSSDLLRGLIAERDMSIILVTHDLGRRRRPVRRRLGDVRRSDRRVRLGARRARAARASLHDGAAGGRPARDHRLRRHDAARVDSRPGATARVVDERMPLRRAVPVRPRRVHDGDPAADPRTEGEGGVRCVRRDEVRGPAGRMASAGRHRRRADETPLSASEQSAAGPPAARGAQPLRSATARRVRWPRSRTSRSRSVAARPSD